MFSFWGQTSVEYLTKLKQKDFLGEVHCVWRHGDIFSFIMKCLGKMMLGYSYSCCACTAVRKETKLNTNGFKRTPSQVVPFPENPCLHVQTCDPFVLVQSAFSSHRFTELHSSISKAKRSNGHETSRTEHWPISANRPKELEL